MGLFDFLGSIFKPIADVVDHLTISGDEKAKLQGAALQAQFAVYQKAMDYESQLLAARSGVIEAETKSDSWLTKSWRPIAALILLGLVVARFLGFTAPNVSPAEYLELWTTVKICLGGYIGGRSIEKTAGAVLTAFKAKAT